MSSGYGHWVKDLKKGGLRALVKPPEPGSCQALRTIHTETSTPSNRPPVFPPILDCRPNIRDESSAAGARQLRAGADESRIDLSAQAPAGAGG